MNQCNVTLVKTLRQSKCKHKKMIRMFFYFVLRNYTNKQWPLKANLVKHIECTLESRCNSLFKANLALTRAPVVVIVIKIIVLIMVIVILLRAAAAVPDV